MGHRRASWRERRCSKGGNQGGRYRWRRGMDDVIALFCCCDENCDQEQRMEESLFGFMVADLC